MRTVKYFSAWAAVGLGASIVLTNGCGALRRSDRSSETSETRSSGRTSIPAAPVSATATLHPDTQPRSPDEFSTDVKAISTPERLSLPTIPLDSPAAVPSREPVAATNGDLSAWPRLGAKLTPPNSGSVTSIDASGTAITDAELANLPAQPELRHLNLRGTRISDAGLIVLKQLPKLEFLGLSQTAVTDGGLAAITTLTQLRYLTLADTAVTDPSVKALSALPQLEGLNIKGTGFTRTGASDLRALLPRCKIVMDESLLAAETYFEQEAGEPVTHAPELVASWGGLESGKVHSQPNPASTAAETRLAEMIEERFGDPQLLATLGDLYRERGDLEGAVVAYQEASRRAPTDIDIHYRLGLGQAELGNWTAARESLTLAIGPAAAEYNLAVILYRQGRIADCRVALDRALKWEPEFPPAHQMLSWLQQPAEPQLASRSPAPATLELLLRALQPSASPATRQTWEVAIQPEAGSTPSAMPPQPRSAAEVGHFVNRATASELPPTGVQPAGGQVLRRYDW